jgi:hypothetical protein
MFIASGPPSILLAPSGATFETELLTELEELNERLFSINISLLAELADILCSVSFWEIRTVLEMQAGYRILLNWCIIWVRSLHGRRLGSGVWRRRGSTTR